jgi:hypothetical protein
MSLDDRDYYREHLRLVSNSDVRRARWSSGRMVVVWILLLTAAFFIASRFMRERASMSLPLRSTAPVSAARDVPAPARPGVSTATVPALPPVVQRGQVAEPIYRCGNSYGLSPCAAGHIVDAPAASGFDSRPSPQLARLVAEGRMPDVTTSSTFTQTVVTQNGVAVGACPTLAADIDSIDRVARRPQSKPDQDRLRARRQATRDQQARLHC